MSKQVTYVMIKDSEYNVYKAQKRRIEELENQIKKHLKNETSVPESSKTASSETTTDSSETEQLPDPTTLKQTGAGAPAAPDIKLMLQEFLSKLSSINYQEGAGTSDGSETLPVAQEVLNLESSTAEVKPTKTEELLPTGESGNESSVSSEEEQEADSESDSDADTATSTNKSVSETQFHKSHLVDNVITRQKKRAISLLHELDKEKDRFRFDDRGQIFVDNVEIPNANFFQLFPKLFKPCNVDREPGLKTVVNELATLGYGHLISPHYSISLFPRTKQVVPNRLEMRSAMRSNKQWYCLAE